METKKHIGGSVPVQAGMPAVTVDTPEFQQLAQAYATNFGNGYYRKPFIDHIDAHTQAAVAQAESFKQVEIDRLRFELHEATESLVARMAAPQQHAQEPSLTKMVEAAKKFTFNYYKIKAGTTYDLPSAAYYVGLIKAMRIPTQQHAQAVHQWRKAGAANWYDGHPDNEGGGGPYRSAKTAT